MTRDLINRACVWSLHKKPKMEELRGLPGGRARMLACITRLQPAGGQRPFAQGLALCISRFPRLLTQSLNILCNKPVTQGASGLLVFCEPLQQINGTPAGGCGDLRLTAGWSKARVISGACSWHLKWRTVLGHEALPLWNPMDSQAVSRKVQADHRGNAGLIPDHHNKSIITGK